MIVRLGMHGATKVRIERPQRTKLVVTQHTFVLVSVPCAFGSPRTEDMDVLSIPETIRNGDNVVSVCADGQFVDVATIETSRAGTGLEVRGQITVCDE